MDLYRDLYENNLCSFGFRLVRQQEREGHLFTVESGIGRGYYWVYNCGNLFAVSEMELSLHSDVEMIFRQPAELQVIGHYESALGVELPGGRSLRTPELREYLPLNGEYRMRYRRQNPVKGTSITLLPGMLSEYLHRRYPGEDGGALVEGLGQPPDSPAMRRLMGEIRSCRGTGLAAKLFYESRVLEALSLLAKPAPSAAAGLPEDDRQRIGAATAYIEAHPAEALHIDGLARLACMSATRFKAAFKAATGRTVARYIAQYRMEQAQDLLRRTDLPVGEIARSVGYRKPGAFARAYRSVTGQLPLESRRDTAVH